MNENPASAPEREAAQVPAAVDAWSLDAACAYADDKDVFFADIKDPERIRYARTVCANCPVVDPCLLDALSRPNIEDNGVRANTTSQERDTMRAQRYGRLEPERVDRALSGTTRIHLSAEERSFAVRRSIELGLPAERLAGLLGIQLLYARKKIAAERRAMALAAATNPAQPRRRAREVA